MHGSRCLLRSNGSWLAYACCAGSTATVPRMYHSVASLVANGAIITAGSNPQGRYEFRSDPGSGVFPSELRVEYYYPW